MATDERLESWLGGIPIKASRVIVPLLRLVFWRHWFVQIGSHIYVLREPGPKGSAGESE